jgi:hypothetical protein
MELTYWFDIGCTGRFDTSACQKLSAGNIGQLGAPGTGVAPAGVTTSQTRATTSTTAAFLTLAYRRRTSPT